MGPLTLMEQKIQQIVYIQTARIDNYNDNQANFAQYRLMTCIQP